MGTNRGSSLIAVSIGVSVIFTTSFLASNMATRTQQQRMALHSLGLESLYATEIGGWSAYERGQAGLPLPAPNERLPANLSPTYPETARPTPSNPTQPVATGSSPTSSIISRRQAASNSGEGGDGDNTGQSHRAGNDGNSNVGGGGDISREDGYDGNDFDPLPPRPPLPLSVTSLFDPARTLIRKYDGTNLNYLSENAGGTPAFCGSISYDPNTRFKMCLSQTAVVVLPPVGLGCTIAATPSTVIAGESLVLTVTTTGEVTRATLDGTIVSPSGGTKTVQPAGPRIYRGRVRGAGGGNVPCEVSVCVQPAGSTFLFNSRYDIDAFLCELDRTSHPEFPTPCPGTKYAHVFNDTITASKVCELKGCSTVIRRKKREYESPGNNSIFYWHNPSNNFRVIGASERIPGRGEANNYMDLLECGGCVFAPQCP